MLNPRINAVIILVCSILLMAAIAGFKFSESFEKDQKERLRVSTESQVAFARYSLQIQMRDLAYQLVQQVEREASGVAPAPEMFRQRESLGQFLALGWFNRAGALSWFVSRPDSVQRMNLEIFERQKAGLPLLKAKDRQIIWTRLTENNGRPLFAMLLEMKSASGLSGVAVGILPAQIFSELGAFYRNQNAEFLLIDDKAYALAYTRPQYIGAEVLNFPIVSTVIQQSSVVGSGVFTHSSGNGEVYAYEKVAQSNLTLLLSRPVDSAPQVLLAYLLNLSGIAMILCLIAGFLIYIVSIRQSRGLDWLKAAVVKMAQGKTFLMPGERIPELREIRDALMVLNTGGNLPPASEPKAKESPSPVSPQQVSPSVARHDLVLEPQTIEKNKALREVGSGIVDSLRPALAAVLGHAQLARSKSNDDPQLKQHFAVIERESRRLRDVLENLEGLVREEEMELTRANLQEVLLMILASLRGQLASKGIILKKSLQDTATVNLPMKAFRFVIEELLANAGDAMGGVGQREIEISTHLEEKEILLLVRDSGKGIAPENLARVFDPFFTSHSHDEKAGLGLTKIKRIISAMNGSIEIQSHEGKGTSVSIRLPLVSRDTKSVPEEKLPKRELSPQRELEEVAVKFSQEKEKSERFASQLGERLPEMKPLTGTAADALPSAPEEDEITFVGITNPGLEVTAATSIDPDVQMASEESQDEDSMRFASLTFNANGKAAGNHEPNNSVRSGELEEGERKSSKEFGEFEVKIRSPKLKV